MLRRGVLLWRGRSCRLSTSSTGLTHVSSEGLPTMVDVSDKSVTKRFALAQSKVYLPHNVCTALGIDSSNLSDNSESLPNEILGKKGPVFATAIVAGVMAAKRTSELIPFCHPIPLENCHIKIHLAPFSGPSIDAHRYNSEVIIQCDCTTTGKTGIEMEALTGASQAALCVYDMLKALSQDLVISETRLLVKRGGKSDFGETSTNIK